jgi:hypothetical protein
MKSARYIFLALSITLMLGTIGFGQTSTADQTAGRSLADVQSSLARNIQKYGAYTNGGFLTNVGIVKFDGCKMSFDVNTTEMSSGVASSSNTLFDRNASLGILYSFDLKRIDAARAAIIPYPSGSRFGEGAVTRIRLFALGNSNAINSNSVDPRNIRTDAVPAITFSVKKEQAEQIRADLARAAAICQQ